MLSKEEMNEFFERLKNDDRFMELFNEFTNEFKAKFVIHDEPDKDLKNILKKCPDDLLNMIWKETMPEAAAIEGGREYREKTLLEEIPQNLEAYLPFVSPREWNLFASVLEGSDLVETTSGYFDKLIPCGWCFAFLIKDDMLIFGIPEEVHSVLKKIEDPDIQAKMVLVGTIRMIHEICVALYGVYSLEQTMYILDTMAQAGEDTEVIKKHFDSVSEILEDERFFCRFDDGYVSIKLDDETIQKILNSREDDWYHPDYEEIKSLMENDSSEYKSTAEYDIAVRAINLGLQNKEYAQGVMNKIADGFKKKDWELSDALDFINDEEIVFATRAVGEAFIKALTYIYKTSRRWMLGGYSREEKDIRVSGMEAINIAIEENKRIYPNDPCPCGSKMKYKKCCGKYF